MIPTKFKVNKPFGSGEEAKNRFSRWPGHLGFPIGTILAMFYLHVTPVLPTTFGVNWPFGSGEAENRFFKMAAIFLVTFNSRPFCCLFYCCIKKASVPKVKLAGRKCALTPPPPPPPIPPPQPPTVVYSTDRSKAVVPVLVSLLVVL